MKRYLALLLILFKFKLSSKLVYSLDFISVFFADGLLFVVQLLAFSAIFRHVNSLNGWSIDQVIVFIGTFTMIDGLVMATFFFGLLTLPEKIRTGDLDIYIVKPLNTLFYVAFQSFNPSSVLIILLGLIIVGYGVSHLGVVLTLPLILGYVFFVLLMYMLWFSLMVIFRVPAFWFVKINSILNFERQATEFAFKVPGVAYQGIMRLVLWVIVPFALIATIPTQFLTGVFGFKYWGLSLSVTFFFVFVAFYLFNRGLAVYSSASS